MDSGASKAFQTHKSRKSRQRAKKAEEKKEKQRVLEAQHASVPGSAQNAQKKRDFEARFTIPSRPVPKQQAEVKTSHPVDIQSMTQKASDLGEVFAERQSAAQRNGFKDHFAEEASRVMGDLHHTLTGEEKSKRKEWKWKSFTSITEKYGDWVDDLGTIAHARDLHGKYEDLDLDGYPSDYNDAYHGASEEAVCLMKQHDRY